MNIKSKDIACKALEMIIKKGANQASVQISHAISNSFDVCDGELEKVCGSSESLLALRIFSEGRYGCFTSNRIVEESLEDFIDECMDAIEYVQRSPYRKLPQKELYYKGPVPDLGIFDTHFVETDPEKKKEIAYGIYRELENRGEIISASSSFSDYMTSDFLIDSNGFEGEIESTLSSVSAECTVADSNRKSMSYWWDASPCVKELNWRGVGDMAYSRAIEKRGAKCLRSGIYDIIIDSSVSQNIIRPLIDAISGDYMANHESFLLNSEGRRIFNEEFTLTDTPWKWGKTGSRVWDGDGVALKMNRIIDNGVLKYRYLNTYNAARMNFPQTVDEPSILTVEPFGRDSIDNGVLITGFNGGNCNIATGDFSYGIEGFLIRDGKRVHPVCGMNFSGNMLNLFNSIEGAGTDCRKCQKWEIPSLVFRECSLSGV